MVKKVSLVGLGIVLAPWIALAFTGFSPLFYFLLGLWIGVYGLAFFLIIQLYKVKKKMTQVMKLMSEQLGAEEKERTQPGLV